MRFGLLLGAIAAVLSATGMPATGAPAYPSRPVRLIVPTPPGNALDISARILAHELTAKWNQTVYVENKPGGSGIPAMLIAKSAAADGYTLLMGPSSSVGINPGLFPKLPYKPLKDFVLISGMYTAPLILVANSHFPYKTFTAVVSAAKKDPGKYSMAYGGPYGTTQHLSAQLFEYATGTKFIGVPYQGSAPAMQDLIGGQTQLLFDSVASALPHVRNGSIQPIAVTSAARLTLLPNVPTVAEQGYPHFEASSWGGVIAPAGVPPEIVKKIATDVHSIVEQRPIQEKLLGLGLVPDLRSSAEWQQFVADEIDKWSHLIKVADIKTQ